MEPSGNNRTLLGIEIGGTKLQVAAGDMSLQILELVREKIEPEQGAAGILKQLQKIVPTLQRTYQTGALGIGFGGPIDSTEGIVQTSHQVNGWDKFPIVEWCQESFGLPTIVRNDCDTAAIAEATLGAGKEFGRVFYVTVGSGIGGGFVCDGVLQGIYRSACSEIGHLRPSLDSVDPHDTVEQIASGFGIAQRIRDNIRDGMANVTEDQKDLLSRCDHQLEQLQTKLIADAAISGNQLARNMIKSATKTLGWAIAQVITLNAPEVVVVGGGVSLMPREFFFNPLENYVSDYVFPPLAQSYEVMPAGLGEAVVVEGALLLAKQLLSEKSTT